MSKMAECWEKLARGTGLAGTHSPSWPEQDTVVWYMCGVCATCILCYSWGTIQGYGNTEVIVGSYILVLR